MCGQVWEDEMGTSAIQRGDAFMDGMVDRKKEGLEEHH
jgi:hypothetical protein